MNQYISAQQWRNSKYVIAVVNFGENRSCVNDRSVMGACHAMMGDGRKHHGHVIGESGRLVLKGLY
jgi:hypothetical protein